MERVILEFAACCRASGMRISTAEVLDGLNQLSLAGPLDNATFYMVLKANFAKSRREQGEFERIFHLFFREMRQDMIGRPGEDEALDGKFAEGSYPDGQDPGDAVTALSARIMDLAGQEKAPLSDLDQALMAFLGGRPQAFIQLVREIHNQKIDAALSVKSNLGQLTGRLAVMLGINRARARVVRFLGDNHAHMGKNSAADTKALEQAALGRLDRAMAFLNQDPRTDNPGLVTGGARDRHYPSLGEIPFANLTRDETAQVREAVDLWVRKLNEIAGLRLCRAKKGGVDVKRTIHRSARYLGVPVEIVRRDRPLKKGKIVTLCDVSGSVWSTARFMLNILYSLEACFARVKTYVFIDWPVEVSDLFQAHGVNQAVKKILAHPRINYNARTDYGLVFQTFHARHLADLDKKTTLILMGDGRSNYLNPREPVLETLRERCRRLVWLNPEQERFWGTGDSEMLRYRNHCNEARACGNLNQLIEFIQALVL